MHVGVSALKKERAIAWRLSAECVSGRISDWVGFSFDDAPT
jgi:hypothetical protein